MRWNGHLASTKKIARASMKWPWETARWIFIHLRIGGLTIRPKVGRIGGAKDPRKSRSVSMHIPAWLEISEGQQRYSRAAGIDPIIPH